MEIQSLSEVTGHPVQKIEISELDENVALGKKVLGNALDVIRNVKVPVTVSAGQCELTVRELVELRENAVLALEKSTHDPVDVIVDGRVVARGMLVAVGDNFGVRITEIAGL